MAFAATRGTNEQTAADDLYDDEDDDDDADDADSPSLFFHFPLELDEEACWCSVVVC